MKRKRLNGANSSNSVFVSTSTSVDPSIVREKGKERSDSVAYPTRCRFCGGMLRVIDKHREDRKLTLQCRRRKCIKFNGLTADKQAKHILSEMAKPKIDYGWYLSDPVRHSYGIFAGDSDSSDSEIDRSNVDVRPIIQDGNIMLRVFGQKRLVRLL
uniref:Nuclear receptor domain-containing protein n=1 Tax=Elaeophora elaphi TaxID=1147741 RepID=A0A0R3RIJ5_9BILA